MTGNKVKTMVMRQTKSLIGAALIALLAACGGGGGGDRAAGVAAGPPNPGGPVTPPDPVLPGPVGYADAEEIFAFITAADIPADGRAVVDFQVTDGNNTAIIDLEPDNVRFILVKLRASPLGNLTGDWQSYVNRIRSGDAGTFLQATTEDDGELTNNGDGTYRYRFVTDVTDLPGDILDQAASEGINLDYEPSRTHRIAMQFDDAPHPLNPIFDWVPETGQTEGVFNLDISATENCNLCHDPMDRHGGRRVEVEYCVTCHNPGTTARDEGYTMAMKDMVHRIHMGADLPSVQAGSDYRFGNVIFPQDIRNCQNCHVGTGTTSDFYSRATLTAQGDNWNEYSTRESCGSCHDDVVWEEHKGGQPDDSRCASCHSLDGEAGSVQDSHRILNQEARQDYKAELLSVSNTGPGDIPEATFSITNPQTGESYDILNDPVWTDGRSRLRVRFSWSTSDFTNTGNGEEDANSVAANALTDATNNGDGTYHIVSPLAIPDGSEAPNIPATGSGMAVIEGRAREPLGDDGALESVGLTNVHDFYSIDESSGQATPRRAIAEIESCQNCHVSVSFHGGSRNDNLNSCASCHNPRNTDREDRLDLEEPPIDGKPEETVDFKYMVHGIHASGYRETPLQVGSRIYDEDRVQYPGDLANCVTCHGDSGFELPLADGVLGSTILSGEDLMDPTDDTVISPATSVCSSCHDSAVARAHMEQNGGSFATTQQAIDDGTVIEQCELCHAPGRSADVADVHGLD
jgi:OmcA/MtrC family decaheme c-type cytochrome